jgi:uncharacterized YigZ family protein
MTAANDAMPVFDLTIDHEYQHEITIKRSRFLAYLIPVRDRDEATTALERLRKEYWDAVHHCYAYRIGEHGLEYRMSDDGEPSGTAGKPILFALQQHRLTNVLCVVVRYFGGVKLGVGPLARAYADAAKEVVAVATLSPIVPVESVAVFCSYDDVSRVIDLLTEVQAQYATSYSDAVRFDVTVPLHRATFLYEELITRTNGRAGFSKVAAE